MKKFLISGALVASMLVPASAMAAQPDYKLDNFNADVTTIGQPGCFGKWRAASSQAIKNQEGVYDLTGLGVYSEGDVQSRRATGDFYGQPTPNVMNVNDKAYCAG